ncbi:unnamed protein product [Danaus chrysippus]|uniref:(African queen) hypothetical protein n=1 Tax=Danaus chrysippus TaxID=151541 RepID=A0A8J2MWA9_9NEOP|nr:unnamed protein product [Danaus chrysippus]
MVYGCQEPSKASTGCPTAFRFVARHGQRSANCRTYRLYNVHGALESAGDKKRNARIACAFAHLDYRRNVWQKTGKKKIDSEVATKTSSVSANYYSVIRKWTTYFDLNFGQLGHPENQLVDHVMKEKDEVANEYTCSRLKRESR